MTALSLRASCIIAENSDIMGGVLALDGGRITSVFSGVSSGADGAALDLGECIIAPGLIDTHIHGCEGADVMDGNAESLGIISASLAKYGVTGFLATTVTTTWRRTLAALRNIAETDGASLPGAHMLGAYSEGVFFNPCKKGAHDDAFFLAPSPVLIEEMVAAAGGKLKVIALAPEIPGALESLTRARELGVTIMLGHTDASYEEALEALEAGGAGGVHIFNGMRGIHHRDPGCAGAVLLNPGAVEVIADGEHLHPAIFQLITRLKSRCDILLISDCMCAGGMEDGPFRLGELTVEVKGGVARTAEGSLAGSTLTLDRAVQEFARGSHVPLHDAYRIASLNPARFLGLDADYGGISAGKRADFAVLSPDYHVMATIVAGKLAYAADDFAQKDALKAKLEGG